MRTCFATVALLACLAPTAAHAGADDADTEPEHAGHAMRGMHERHEEREAAKTRAAEQAKAKAKADDEQMMRLMKGPLHISRTRGGSGTSWLPDDAPMYGVMLGLGDWVFMAHENIFFGFEGFTSERGAATWTSMNWLMASATRVLPIGEVGLRAMFSAEPLTVGEDGYPLILQTGESAHSQPLHDRQHAHDLFMELAATMKLSLGDQAGIELYGGPVGEPALGPPAYPHRPSAISNPWAPIGHHWEDGTHITEGVVTGGVFTHWWKLEVSWFNGREPDENRFDIDFRPFDSVSARLTFNPVPAWSLQASWGYLSSPEALRPQESLHRVTASALWSAQGFNGRWDTTFLFGANIGTDGSFAPAGLVETNWTVDVNDVVFGRAEVVAKSGEELVIPDRPPALYGTAALELGYVRAFGPILSLQPGLGFVGSLSFVDERLFPFYGTVAPVGAMVFVQLRPAAMEM